MIRKMDEKFRNKLWAQLLLLCRAIDRIQNGQIGRLELNNNNNNRLMLGNQRIKANLPRQFCHWHHRVCDNVHTARQACLWPFFGTDRKGLLGTKKETRIWSERLWVRSCFLHASPTIDTALSIVGKTMRFFSHFFLLKPRSVFVSNGS